MLKGLFKRNGDEHAASANREKHVVMEGQEEEAEEAMSVIAREGQDSLDQTMEEINESVQEAAKASLRDIRMMDEGRCPSCGHKTHQFLFTSVCEHCGWFSFISPEEGKSIIHLKNNGKVECGTTFDTKGGYILGITDGVIRAKVSKENVDYIEFVWTDDEIMRKREIRLKEEAGVCGWCENSLTDSDSEEDPVIVYAAFGNHQDRYTFCSKRCNRAFQRQYPVRIHKNCYNRSCIDCNLCIKKYSGEDETFLKHLEKATV